MSGSTSADLLALASPGKAALLKHALDAGVDPNATYFENVATPSLSPLLKQARERGSFPAGWENETTLLEMASSYKDNVDTVKLLLAAKADANATCWLSQTALCRAIIVGAADTVDLLLTAGAEPSTSYAGLVQSEPWGGEIGCCIPYRQRGVDDMVVPDQPEEHDPAHLDILNMLLARTTANVNATTDHGLTALHNAARCGFGPIVERLIAAGADLNHDADGYSYEMRGTPLRVAIVARHSDVVLLLLRSKADPNKVGAFDRLTPLATIAERDAIALDSTDVAMVKALLEHGANPNHHATVNTAADDAGSETESRGDSARDRLSCGLLVAALRDWKDLVDMVEYEWDDVYPTVYLEPVEIPP